MQGCLWNDQNLGGTGNGGSGAGFQDEYGNSPTEAQASGNADNFYAVNEGAAPSYNFSPSGLTTNFSVRWQGTFTFSGGSYTFTAASDDGDAMYIDNTPLIGPGGTWMDRGCSNGGYTGCTNNVSLSLTPGQHTIKYEYYQDGGGATAQLSWIQTASLPAPTATLNIMDNWAYTSFVHHDIETYGWNGGVALSWSSTNATGCTMTDNGNPAAWSVGTSNGNQGVGNISGISHTYVLTCTGSGGTATDTRVLTIPATPTNVVASCGGSGTSASVTWNQNAAYGESAPQLYTTSWALVSNGDTTAVSGTNGSYTFPAATTPGQTYNILVYARDGTQTDWPYSDAASATVTCATPAPVTASLTVNTTYGSASNGGSVTTHGYGDTPTLTWSSTGASSCTVTSDNGDSQSGLSGTNVSAKTLPVDTGAGHTWTYTLNCSGAGGSASQFVHVVIPPAPTNVTMTSPAGCGTSGTTLSYSWTLPGGYNTSYVRIYDNTTNSYLYASDQTYSTLTWSGTTIPGHTYSAWFHTSVASGAYSLATYAANVTCNNPPVTGTLYGTNYTQSNPTVGSVIVQYGGNTTVSWTTANVSSCSISGTNGDSYNIPYGQLNTVNGGPVPPSKFSAITGPVTYTLNCVGNNGTTYNNLSTLVVTNPPTPTLSSASCNSAGSASSMTFTPVSGWRYYYVYMFDKSGSVQPTTPGTGACSDGNFPGINNGTCIWTYDSNNGTTLTYNTIPNHQYYWIIYTEDGPDHNNTGAWGNAATDGSNPISCNVVVGPPGGGGVGVTATQSGACPSPTVTLNWTAGSNATSYNIYRAIHGQAAALLTTVGNVLTYVDTPPAGNTYDYWVASVGNATEVAAASNSSGIAPYTCGGPGPASATAVNSTCSKIGLYWSSVAGAVNYNIYRSLTNSQPGVPTYSGVPLATAASPYVDSAVVSGQVYYYWVTANLGVSGESSATPTGSISPLACTPNFTSSNKEILSINGNAVSGANNDVCNGQTNPLGSTLINKGDTLEFAVNACNNTGNATATVTTIVDSLTNMQQASGGWNAQYCLGNTCSSLSPTVSGTAPNQVLTFTINQTIPWGANALPGVLTYYASPASASSSSNYCRMQNSAIINYAGGIQNVNTPLILFYCSSSPSPTRQEIAP